MPGSVAKWIPDPDAPDVPPREVLPPLLTWYKDPPDGCRKDIRLLKIELRIFMAFAFLAWLMLLVRP